MAEQLKALSARVDHLSSITRMDDTPPHTHTIHRETGIEGGKEGRRAYVRVRKINI